MRYKPDKDTNRANLIKESCTINKMKSHFYKVKENEQEVYSIIPQASVHTYMCFMDINQPQMK